MNCKIGIIHATNMAIQPMADVFNELYPEVEVMNFLNENLLINVNKKGKVEASDLRDFMKLLLTVADTDVKGIIVACSIFCPYVSIFRYFLDIPIIAVDEPMIEKAVELGNKIGIIATTAPSGPSAEKQIIKYASKINKVITTEIIVITEAMNELKKKNFAEHDKLITDAVKKLVEHDCDAIIFAQITMARAAKSSLSEVIVLTSPHEGVIKIMEEVNKY